MFWQGGFDSRQANFYVNVGNSFAPHIIAPGSNGGLHVSCIIFPVSFETTLFSNAALYHYTIYRFECICMFKHMHEISVENRVKCFVVHTQSMYRQYFIFHRCFFRTLYELCWSVFSMHRHTSTISALQVKRKTHQTYTNTCTWTINFEKWLIGVKLLIGQGCMHKQGQKADFSWRYR